ncbi:DNA methylase [Verrucomicrobia bacterium]|nr:DNA methylase [Verrucomicrobiota bacterium]
MNSAGRIHRIGPGNRPQSIHWQKIDVLFIVAPAMTNLAVIETPQDQRKTAPIPREDNKLRLEDRAAHGWYRFVLSFPAHLVRAYVERFELAPHHTVLDPFCGTGTTLVECKKLGIQSCGIEPNPMAAFASRTKVDWEVDPDALTRHATRVAQRVAEKFASEGIEDEGGLPLFQSSRPAPAQLRSLPPEALKLLLTDSISPLPLHKTLLLLETLDQDREPRLAAHEHLALAKTLVNEISNLHFGPEIGVGPAKPDAAVVGPWLRAVKSIAADLRHLHQRAGTPAAVHQADSRELVNLLGPASIDAVITSPPYPNEKDYTRTTRLESVLLGFIKSKDDLRRLKQNLVRSNTRSVYKSDTDDRLVEGHNEIQRIAEAIEQRRIELGKTSGFERLYARVTKLYFGGMLRHLTELRAILRPGAHLAYVVGDQASYLRIMIRTGQLLADLAKSAGYEVVGTDLFRTRLATATKEQLREEVVIFRWPGPATVNGWPKPEDSAAMVLKDEPTKATMSTPPANKRAQKANRYSAIIEKIFFSRYEKGMREIPFERQEMEKLAAKLKVKLPKNLGDLVYSFRYRALLPTAITSLAGEQEIWIIRPAGRSKYSFVLVKDTPIVPNEHMAVTKVPDATPGIVAKYAFNDEQALLAKVRYNRLVDIFSGVTCYSLQNHLRTTVPDMGQVETDEIYIGVDKKGAHYAFPIQAKGGKDKLNVVQIEQDFAVCATKFPLLVCRPIAAQFMDEGVIALFEFESGENGVTIASEKHYKLVAPKEVTDTDLETYRGRLETPG